MSIFQRSRFVCFSRFFRFCRFCPSGKLSWLSIFFVFRFCLAQSRSVFRSLFCLAGFFFGLACGPSLADCAGRFACRRLPVFLCLAFSLQCKAFLFRSGQDRLTHLARTPLFRIRQGPAWRFVRKQNPVISHNPIKKQDICRQKENLSEKRSDFELFGLMRLRKLTGL